MKRLLGLGIAVAIIATSSATWAAGAPPSPEQQAAGDIQTRQGLFKVLAAQFGPVGGMMRNQVPFDAAVVAKNAARLETLAGIIPEVFANDTSKFTATPSKALPGIWNAQADFKTKADGLATAAAALAAAAKGGDQAATLKAAAGIGTACGACHDAYRAK
ncbi:MAG: cytochrome c [Nevskiaceae bacterium]|jgi:cytochrome c556|nr:cytochrome c [Nevskiaceae bacterium]